MVGTHALLPESERARLVGYIINRFRGDPSLFTPAIEDEDELDRREALTQLLARYAEAYAALSQEKPEAAELFSALHRDFPADAPAAGSLPWQ